MPPTSFITVAQRFDVLAEYGRILVEEADSEKTNVPIDPGVPSELPGTAATQSLGAQTSWHSTLLGSSQRFGYFPNRPPWDPPPFFPEDDDPWHGTKDPAPTPPPKPSPEPKPEPEGELPIGIIGAGPAGLYAALILDSLDIKYEILEASGRVGGRVQTYRFPPKDGKPNGTHDYYDLGPMRFPETPIMTRTFKLFNYPPLNTGDIQVSVKLIPYYFDTKYGNGIYYYNGNRYKDNDLPNIRKYNFDPFQDKQLRVPDAYLKVGTKAIFDDVIGPFAKGLEGDLNSDGRSKKGWKKLMEFDSYSTRSYMSHVYTPSEDLVKLGLPKGKHLPTNVVNWIESYDKTTGWYDRALATTVLEEMAFGFTTQDPKPVIRYWCLDGGTVVLTDSMAKYIDRQTNNKGILLNHRVTSVSIKDSSDGDSPLNVTVVNSGKKQVKTYPHVISTVPLTVLRHTMDISGCELSALQTSALRQLAYTPAVKIGIKFRSPWWTTAKDRDGKVLNIVGGRSFTDRPVRVVVYPSYGLGEADKPAVLIASFVWTEDAARVGALIGSQDEDVSEQLKNMVLRDLADIHNVECGFLEDQYIDQYCVDWADNPLTMGAFALFGPGKFQDLYLSLIDPAGRGKLHFAGEAISVRHGWIVGALDSAWRCVYKILVDAYPDKVPDFLNQWGFNTEWLKSGSEDARASAILPEGMAVIDPEHPKELPKDLLVPKKPTLGVPVAVPPPKKSPPSKKFPGRDFPGVPSKGHPVYGPLPDDESEDKEGEDKGGEDHGDIHIPQQKNNLFLRHVALSST